MSDTVSFLPFQNLESGRLLLRQITPDDIPAIFKLRSNPETMKYVPRPVLSKLEEAEEHYKLIQDKIEKNEGINWAITLKTSPDLIGIIGHYRIKWEHFRSEIGYMILPEYHGQGIVTEAVKLIIPYGFDYMKMHSIEAIIDPANIASAKVLEKNKFVKEGHFRQNEYFNGKFLDRAIYSLLKEDYFI